MRSFSETSREYSRRRRGLGNSRDRRRRRAWLLKTFGDGRRAPCYWCGVPLDRISLTTDRHPLPGRLGGTYRRTNVVPACATCNGARESELMNELAAEAREAA